MRPVSKAYAGLRGASSACVLTYFFLLLLVGLGAAVQRFDLRKFLPGFTAIFWISVVCWLAGHYAYIAQTPDKRAGMGISWSLGLTGEAGYLVALLAGLVVGNVFPGLAGLAASRGPCRSGSSRRRS